MTKARANLLPWLLGALALTLLFALWSWFDRNFEQRPREITTGWSSEARRNPFLAAERFLTSAGIDAESVSGRELLRDLPPPGDMLVVNGLDALNRQRREGLRAWLEDGGRLFVEATRVLEPDEAPRADDFLAGFGALLRAHEQADNRQSEVIAKIDFDAASGPVEVGFLAHYFLQDIAGEAVGSATAESLPRLLQYRVGLGLLTVTSDNVFLTNADIGNHDHALALALLSLDANKVWLIYDDGAPGLATLLWRSAPQASIAAGLLLAAMLWHLGARIGPRLPTPERARRNLADHLEAAAALMWRYGRAGLLIEETRRRVEQAWLRRHPLLHEMDDKGRAGWIGDQVGADAAKVYDALYRRHHQTQDFTAQSRLLQRLWTAL